MTYLLIVLFFVILTGFFAGIETAFITANPLKIYGKMKKVKAESRIISLFNRMDMVINTILIGTNISVVSAAIFFSFFFRQWFSLTKSIVLSTSILTPFMLIFSEIIPKAFSLKYANKIILKFYPILRFFMILFFPVAYLLQLLNKALVKERKEGFISREEVEFLFYKEGEVKNYEDEKDFIYSVFYLSEVKVKEIMIPLNDMNAININLNKEKVLEKIKNDYYSRLPVYEEEIYNPVGYINVRELLFNKDKPISSLLKKTLFFPETKPADETLFEIQKAKVPLAFVVDEYGAISGLVTKEDLVELIVGNIEDELHQEDSIEMVDNGIIVPGSEDVDNLNHQFSLGIEKEDFETLAGFVSYKLSRLPVVGDKFTHNGFQYTILETSRIAEKIRITGGNLG